MCLEFLGSFYSEPGFVRLGPPDAAFPVGTWELSRVIVGLPVSFLQEFLGAPLPYAMPLPVAEGTAVAD